jgi:hypothetical protein
MQVLPPPMAMVQMVTGYIVSQIVRAVAELSIADHLAEGPATAAELAAKESADKDGVYRLLRAAASFGIVSYDPSVGFGSTPLLETLRAGPGSLRGFAISQTNPGHWLPMGRLTEAVRSGKNQSVATLGYEQFDYYSRNPAEAAAFTLMMQATSEFVKAEAVRLIDASSVATIVDIGGANGAFVCAFVAANPAAKGVVYDLPHIAPLATEYARVEGLSDRVSAVAGDFFQSVPQGDLYLLKQILHDWDDASCVQTLSHCAKSLSSNGRVIVVEQVIGAIGEPGVGPLIDMLMLGVNKGGKERTLDEFSELFKQSGLKLRKVTPTQSPFSLIEAIAA